MAAMKPIVRDSLVGVVLLVAGLILGSVAIFFEFRSRQAVEQPK